MKKIIVPTDFSEGAFKALTHALHYAEKLDFSVEVVHAFMMPPTGTAVMVDITDVLKKNALEEMGKLRIRVEALKLAHKVEILYKAEHGSVVDVIRRASADGKHTAFIVMGTQGASGITEKWLGSNTASAARNVDIPLLAIPADRDFKNPSNICFSTDLKELSDIKGLSILALISKAFNAKIKFLHVRKKNETNAENDGHAFREQINKVLSEEDVHYAFTLDENVASGIADAIDKDGSDMLVLARHEYGFFQNLFHSSVTQQVVNEAALPVLVIKG